MEIREKDRNNEWCFWVVPDLKVDCCKWFCLCESLYLDWSLILIIRTDKMFLKREATKRSLLG